MSEQFSQEGQDLVCVLFHCGKSHQMLAMIRAQWMRYTSGMICYNGSRYGATAKARGWGQLGCDDSGSAHLMIQELQSPKVSNAAFLGVCPFSSPHEIIISNVGSGVPETHPRTGDQ